MRTFEDLKKHLSRSDEDKVNIYLDTHGGDRSFVYAMIAACEIFESEKNIQIKGRYSVHFDPKRITSPIVEETEAYSYLDLATGLRAFLAYGRAELLNKYLKECAKHGGRKEENDAEIQLTGILSSIADSIQVCDMEGFIKAVRELKEFYLHLDASPVARGGRLNSGFSLILDDIWNSYGELLNERENDFELESISWCVRKGHIQQALTLYVEYLPDLYSRLGLFRINGTAESMGARQNAADLYGVFLSDSRNGKDQEDIPAGRNLKELSVDSNKNVQYGNLDKDIQKRICKFIRKNYDGSRRKKTADQKLPRNLEKMIELLQNGTADGKLIRYLLTGSDENPQNSIQDRDTEQKHIEQISKRTEVIRNMAECNPDELSNCLSSSEVTQLMTAYLMAKIFRNQLNHAVRQKMPDEVISFFEEQVDKQEFDIDDTSFNNIRKALRWAVKLNRHILKRFLRNSGNNAGQDDSIESQWV